MGEVIAGIFGIVIFLVAINVGFRILGAIFGAIFGGVKATVKTASGKGSFTDNLNTEIRGMGDFRFEVKKETRTIENKQSEFFVMNKFRYLNRVKDVRAPWIN